MRRLARRFLVAAAALVIAAGAIGFVAYDVFVFQGHLAETMQALQKADPEDLQPPAPVGRLIEISEDGNLSGAVAKILVAKSSVTPQHRGLVSWFGKAVLWKALIAIHLSRQQQLSILASRSYHIGQPAFGLSAEARRRYQRPLSGLTLPEAATVVASAHVYVPEKQVAYRDWLLRQLKNDT